MITKFKSSISVKLALIMIAVVIVLSATLIFVSSSQIQSVYKQQLESIGSIIRDSMQQKYLEIKTYIQLAENTQAMGQTTAGRQLQEDLESYISENKIKNVYLLYPELIEEGENGSLRWMALSQNLLYEGLLPNDLYPLSPQFKHAIDQLQTKTIAITDPYINDLGAWVSILSPIQDPSGNTLAYFGIDFDASTIQNEINEKIITSAIISIIVGAIFILIIYLIIRFMLKPIKTLSVLADQAAQGDLSVSIEVKSKNELGQLASHFNTMIHNLRSIIEQVKQMAEQVNDSSQELLKNAGETNRAAEKVASSMEQIADGSKKQMLGTQDSSRAMEEMASGIQNIAESASLAAESSVNALGKAQHSNQEIQIYSNEVESIQNSVSQSITAIQKLSHYSEEIGQITSTIASIASQTNILSLNAAIEAARAGEHGKGFHVVATEIRKLAEQSTQATERISSLISNIQQATEETVTVITSGSENIGNIIEIFRKIRTVFGEIVQSVEQINSQMQEVSAVSEQMSASSEEVSASITELAKISDDTSNSSEPSRIRNDATAPITSANHEFLARIE